MEEKTRNAVLGVLVLMGLLVSIKAQAQVSPVSASLVASQTYAVSSYIDTPNYLSGGVLICKNSGLVKAQHSNYTATGYDDYFAKACVPNTSFSPTTVKPVRPYSRVYLTGVADGKQKAKDCIAWGKLTR